MSRKLTVGVAQLGPIARNETREQVAQRLLALLHEAHDQRVELLVYPELALTTFFPRWFFEDETELNSFYETQDPGSPGTATEQLYRKAAEYGIGIHLGYAELTADGHRFNTALLTERDGTHVGKFRKVHIPGHEEHEPHRRFQHLERRYFEESPEGFKVWGAFGGIIGMAICNDRRWPETYRVMGMQGAELVLIGYNTPLHYPPDPTQDPLQSFHNHLVMQSGAYQNGMWVVGAAKGGTEEGCELLAHSCIVAPSGQIVAQAVTNGDELIRDRIDFEMCRNYKETLFDFARYRRPEVYKKIVESRGVVIPDGILEAEDTTTASPPPAPPAPEPVAPVAAVQTEPQPATLTPSATNGQAPIPPVVELPPEPVAPEPVASQPARETVSHARATAPPQIVPAGTDPTASFVLNGEEVSVYRHHPHLLAALREELHVISPKDGCSPTGQCGCCTVLVDGKARVSCQTSLEKADGAEIITLEGFADEERHRFTAAFAAYGALQCGFCTPGIVVRAKSLIDKKGNALSREEASRHLGGHLCRCTGYVKVLDAVMALAKGESPEPQDPGGVGSSGVKYEAPELAEGSRPYIDDMFLPDMAHAAVRLSDYARADVVSINTAPAEAIEGVLAVYTAADVPGDLRVGIIHKDWPIFIPEGGRTSYLGDVMAVVVAETVETARAAAQMVEIEYAPLEPYFDPVIAAGLAETNGHFGSNGQASSNGQPISNGQTNAVWELDGNILSQSQYARGDAEAALATSAHVVHDVFQTQRIEHAFVEPESTLAVPMQDGTMKVYSGGQGVWDDRNQIAAVLGVSPETIVVELVSNGGAFGGKEDMSNQAQTALAAHLLGRPVKCTLSREESLLMHPKRHPIRLEYWAGCDEDGKLTALKARMVGDSGPYASVGMKVLERAAGHASGPYHLPAIDVLALAVRTNNPVCGAFRGFGANQAQFAMEGVLDRLAEKAGISGWEIRSRNVIEPGKVWGPGQIMDDGCLGAKACLDAVKQDYEAAVAQGKPVGVGLGLKNSGLGNGFNEVAKAVVRFGEDNSVEVRHCWTEMGQGIHTVAQQVAVQELGVDPAAVRIVVDTTRELGAGQTTGSRGTLMGAGAVADACRKAKEGGCQPGVDYEGEYVVDWTNSLNDGLENPVIHSTFGYAAQLVVLDPDSGDIERVLAVHDVGKAVNPQLCEGQVEGAVHMGLGYALSEGFPVDETSRPRHNMLRPLGIIRPKDMPQVDVVLVECPQPNAPYGIKGVGEIGLVPTAGAVAAALHDHDGQWRAQLPMDAPEQYDTWVAPKNPDLVAVGE